MSTEPSATAGGFLGRMLALAELRRAWLKVLANGGKPGGDGVGLAAFAARLDAELAQLRREVMAGAYRPRPMLAVGLAKRDGGRRELAIPCVRDRVLQTAYAQALSPILEPQFEPCSYAYRPGRSIRMAAEAVLRGHRRGLGWVVDADIDRFFDNIVHRRLLECLRPFLPDAEALALLQSWLGAELLQAGQARRLWRGLPQGSPLSPLLSNLYLDAFDEALEAQGHTLVRYADDFVLLCPGREEARRGLQCAQRALEGLDLRVNPEKTRIVDFRAGLDFLGVHFAEPAPGAPLLATSAHPALLPARPDEEPTMSQTPPENDGALPEDSPAAGAAEPAEPLLRSLYVTGHGSRLGIAGERFTVKPLDEDEQEVPALKVDQIILFGHAQASTQALHYCFKQGVPVLFASAGGELRGVLQACENRFAQRQRLQFLASEDAGFSLELARALVSGKIANGRTVLQRYARRHHADAGIEGPLLELSAQAGRAQAAADLEQLRGFEGAAAKAYFDGWRGLLPPRWGFGKRDKHPAGDPVNALLNLGYSLLYQNMRTLLAAEGLNPALGFLHAAGDGHAALASDMVEEFRAVAVDAWVFGDLLGGKGFQPEDFILDAGAEWPCSMKPEPLHRFLEKFEAKMNSPFSHPDEPRQLDLRRVMQRQCRRLAEAVARRGGYRPLRIR